MACDVWAFGVVVRESVTRVTAHVPQHNHCIPRIRTSVTWHTSHPLNAPHTHSVTTYLSAHALTAPAAGVGGDHAAAALVGPR